MPPKEPPSQAIELEGAAESNADDTYDITAQDEKHRFWRSARMTLVICTFIAMTMQLCMRNSLSTVILCMTPSASPEEDTRNGATDAQCGRSAPINGNGTKLAEETRTELGWTREQGVLLQGTFYWGYAVIMPFAGQLSDRFGGKLFLILSLTVQAGIFMLIPVCARLHYYAATAARIFQGAIAGFCVPSIFQLFTTWCHPTERTLSLTIAFAGFNIGTLISMPLASFICSSFGWQVVFYSIGAVALAIGISFIWLVFNKLDQHPRLSRQEYDYLAKGQVPKVANLKIPWKQILTSVPVYAVIITHFFHTYGLLMMAIMLPRFLKEATKFSLSDTGKIAALVFAGPIISKILVLVLGSKLEANTSINLTKVRRLLHVICNVIIIFLIGGILLMSCRERWFIVVFWIIVAILGDFAFSAAYWPSLLYIAPSYAGLLSGIANCIGTSAGFIIPPIIAVIVKDGKHDQWDIATGVLLVTYAIDALVFGLFGSFRLQPWAVRKPEEPKSSQQ